MSIALTQTEIAEITARERPTAQARVLAGMGIPYRRRPDGSLVVLRRDVYETEKEAEQSPAMHL